MKNDELPKTFEDIGKFSKPNGYFALLYIDGDGFGTEIEKCRTLPEIQEFAMTVDSALCESRQAATRQFKLPTKSFDVLLQGGDDLVIALPAQYALELAHQSVVDFRERTKGLSRDLRVSVAVVWAHNKFPFAVFFAFDRERTQVCQDRRRETRRTRPH